MEQRRIGTSGLTVSAIGLGGNTFGATVDGDDAVRTIQHAIGSGITFIDTADVYSQGRSEELVGQAVAGRREQVVIATKCGITLEAGPHAGGLSRRWVTQAAEDSLRRLGTDYIDLFQLHGFDAQTPVEEVLSTLDDLVRAGKLRYLGVSNFSGWHLMKSLALADRYGWSRYVAHQAYYSLIGREYEWELMPVGLDQGVGAVVWSPLGWGRLTGRIRRGQPLPQTSRLHKTAENGPPVEDERLFRIVEAIDAIAAETGKTVPQIALNWLLQRPTVSTVIIGARNEEQLVQNLGAVGWSLTPEHVARLDEASHVTPVYPYWHQRGFAERNPAPV